MPSKQTVFCVSLVCALLASNGLWSVQASCTNQRLAELEHALADRTMVLQQTLSVLPVAADEDASLEEVIAAAQRAGAAVAPYEHDGLIWVDKLGLEFGEDGRLISVSTGELLRDDAATSAARATNTSGLAISEEVGANSI